MNLKSDVDVKKSALTPALSPRRGRNIFRVRARSRRWICDWFRSSIRGCFEEDFTSAFSEGRGSAELKCQKLTRVKRCFLQSNKAVCAAASRLREFRGSRREILIRGNLSPFCCADSAKCGEARRRVAHALMTEATCGENFAGQTASLDLKCNCRHCSMSMPAVDTIFSASNKWGRGRWLDGGGGQIRPGILSRDPVPETRSWLNGQRVPNRRDWVSCFANSIKNSEEPQFLRRWKRSQRLDQSWLLAAVCPESRTVSRRTQILLGRLFGCPRDARPGHCTLTSETSRTVLRKGQISGEPRAIARKHPIATTSPTANKAHPKITCDIKSTEQVRAGPVISGCQQPR